MAIKEVYIEGFTYNPTDDTNPVVPAIVDVVQGESQMANPATDVVWDSGLGAAKFFMDFEAPTQTGSTIAGRTEHTSRYPPVMEAEEMWFSASYYFPVGEAVDPEDEILYQWHVGAVTGSPSFALRRKNGRFVVYLWIASGFENQMAFDIGPATNDIRHDFVVYLFMHPTDGHLTVWKDGMLARCHNPLTGAPWSVPTSPPGGGITNDYTAYPELGAIQQEDDGVSLLVWNGKTARGTYPNPTKYPKWGMYKPAWGTRYNPDKSIKPEAYDPLSPLYVAPEFREKTIYISNIKFETRVEEFSDLEIYNSLDTDGESPLEVPEWWVWTEYTVTVIPSTGGSVSGGGTYTEDDEATLIATPDTGWHFVRWSNNATDNPYTFTVTGDVTLQAIFAQDEPVPGVIVVKGKFRIV